MTHVSNVHRIKIGSDLLREIGDVISDIRPATDTINLHSSESVAGYFETKKKNEYISI